MKRVGEDSGEGESQVHLHLWTHQGNNYTCDNAL